MGIITFYNGQTTVNTPSTSTPQAQTIFLYQKQPRIYPRSIQGWYQNWRWIMVWVTQCVFYGLPWLPWHGRQAVLFDLDTRRFYIFDLLFYPQDFIYLTSLLILCAYALFLFTAVAGRLWCGYACPQTVYSEIFMWIERRIEGDRNERLRRDKAPLTWHKLQRKFLTHSAWLIVATWTGFTFVGYFTPIHALKAEAMSFNFSPWEWFWVGFYSLATYGNAGFLREQVCKYMCPYARFQSAMFDKDTLVVTYDAQRGEPRGNNTKAKSGACIDCGLCVQVCPTGIDIRNGLQYECIGCAACVDACNQVMDKYQAPRGLVRYATQNHLDKAQKSQQILGSTHLTLHQIMRPRVLIYSTILILLSVGMSISLALRNPFRVDVVRDRASLGRIVDGGHIENVYRLQIMNATEYVQQYRIHVSELTGATVVGSDTLTLGPAQSAWKPVTVQLQMQQVEQLSPGSHPITFQIEQLSQRAQQAWVSEKSTFLLPR